jgi:hypothetical protein
MHVHADRRPLLAAADEEAERVVERPADQLVGVVEVDRRYAQRAGRWQHDQLSVGAVALDLVDQAAVRVQADRVQRDARRATGRLL